MTDRVFRRVCFLEEKTTVLGSRQKIAKRDQDGVTIYTTGGAERRFTNVEWEELVEWVESQGHEE